jgi:hypothetical protein
MIERYHYLRYRSSLFSGDSCAALIHADDGTVLGVHLETVNEASEALRKGEYDLETVAESVNNLIQGFSQGFVGLRLDCPELLELLDNYFFEQQNRKRTYEDEISRGALSTIPFCTYILHI